MYLGHMQVHDADLVCLLDDLPRVLSGAVVLRRLRDDLLAGKLRREQHDPDLVVVTTSCKFFHDIE